MAPVSAGPATTHDASTAAPLLRSAGGSRTAGSARSLLVTVLGELVWPAAAPVRTTTLVQVLRGLGVEEQTARQAIARAAASDWITSQKHGREVLWTLTPKLAGIFETGSRRVYAMSDPFSDWDGSWLTLLVNVPHAQRATRRPLYAGLTWAGLGNPAPGLWVTPHTERVDEVRALLEPLGLRGQTLAMIGTVDATGIGEAEIVSRGWDLDSLREHYDQVQAKIYRLEPSTDRETLLAHVQMLNEWQDFPRTDPQLPESLAPDWVGRRVARTIESQRARWIPAARRAFAAIEGAG